MTRDFQPFKHINIDFKTELGQSALFNPRLQAKILNVVDVSYGRSLFSTKPSNILSNIKFLHERDMLEKKFEKMSENTGKYVCGVEDTMKALGMSVVETLIFWEDLEINRYQFKHSASGETIVKHLSTEQEIDERNSHDLATAAELVVHEKIPLLEWFAKITRSEEV